MHYGTNAAGGPANTGVVYKLAPVVAAQRSGADAQEPQIAAKSFDRQRGSAE